jgi:hypothetical protein
MNIYWKALSAGAIALALSGPASAHGQVRVRVAAVPYGYPPVVRVVPRYAPPPVYYVVAEPDWDARRDGYRYRGHWRHHRHHRHHHHHGYGRY